MDRLVSAEVDVEVFSQTDSRNLTRLSMCLACKQVQRCLGYILTLALLQCESHQFNSRGANLEQAHSLVSKILHAICLVVNQLISAEVA